MKLWFRPFCRFNRLVARLRGAVGWCAMGYHFNRIPFIIREDGYEDYVHTAMNPFSACWGHSCPNGNHYGCSDEGPMPKSIII